MYDRSNLFIGGQWLPSTSGWLTEIISPATEDVIGRVVLGNVADVDAAMAAAVQARYGRWSHMSFEQRAGVIEEAADHIAGRVDEIAPQLSADMGTPLLNAQNVLVPTAARMMRTAIDCARQVPLRQVRRDAAGAVLV